MEIRRNVVKKQFVNDSSNEQSKDSLKELYLTRFYILPKNKYFNIYLHKFSASDFDEAPHSHPWWSISFLLWGNYREIVEYRLGENKKVSFTNTYLRNSIWPIYRPADHIHRIELIDDKPTWTLFITGPVTHEWYFFCKKGPVHHKDYLTPDGLSVGKGCD